VVTALYSEPTRLQIVKRDAWIPGDLQARIRQWSPKSELGRIVRECFKFLPAELAGELLERITRCVVLESALEVLVLRANGRHEDHGIVSRKVVTTAGVGFLVDAFQNSVELENMKFHALGTSSQAEAAGDTGCVTELTTEYTGDVRATGSTEEGASANIYKTIGTNTMDEVPAAIEEHAIMSQAATGGGVCLDRSLTGTITLGSGDALQSTYQLTCSAGG